MSFSIRFLSHDVVQLDDGQKALKGQITLGDFQETFLAYLDYWSSAEYEHQWRNAIEQIASGGHQSALVTDMHDPKTADHIVWWPMWREEDNVFVHNQLLFLNAIERPFALEAAISQIGEREQFDEDGEKISEWRVSTRDLLAFYKSAGGWRAITG